MQCINTIQGNQKSSLQRFIETVLWKTTIWQMLAAGQTRNMLREGSCHTNTLCAPEHPSPSSPLRRTDGT